MSQALIVVYGKRRGEGKLIFKFLDAESSLGTPLGVVLTNRIDFVSPKSKLYFN
jgi:hypothetical protein